MITVVTQYRRLLKAYMEVIVARDGAQIHSDLNLKECKEQAVIFMWAAIELLEQVNGSEAITDELYSLKDRAAELDAGEQ